MFPERQRKVLAAASQLNLHALLALPGPNLRYLTGFHTRSWERFTGAFFTRTGQSVLLVPQLDEEKARQAIPDMDIRAYSDADGPAATLHQTCSALGLTGHDVGVEDTIPLRHLQLLRQAAHVDPVDATHAFTAARIRKDSTELGQLHAAQQVVEGSIRHAWQIARAGMTERELAFEIGREVRQRGAEAVPFAAVQSGPHSALPHFEHSERALRAGELLLLDVGCAVQGYHADITRTIAIGTAGPQARAIHQGVLRAQEAAIHMIRPGVTTEAVDGAARQVITAAGYGDHFIHRTGHGLGLEVHEEPYLRSGDRTRLEPGMVVTVEPGIYLPDAFGVRIEDDVVVTADGSADLTTLPKTLDWT